MSFKPGGPGAGETQPSWQAYRQVPAPLGGACLVSYVYSEVPGSFSQMLPDDTRLLTLLH